MTLVLTELSLLGIAMAADSAVSFKHANTGNIHVRPNAARKLQKIPYLKAGISCWGLGKIGEIPTDQWLTNFISSNSSLSTLKNFADELAVQLNAQISPNTTPNCRLGFHLAGFETFDDKPTPSFYHVHEGASTTLQQRGISVNPNQFNANHDVPPPECQMLIAEGKAWITRNGDYILYASIFDQIGKLFQQLHEQGIVIPHSQDLSNRAEYLVFQIRTMSEIYRLSNLIPGIGGGIHYLTINPTGIHSEGIKYF